MLPHGSMHAGEISHTDFLSIFCIASSSSTSSSSSVYVVLLYCQSPSSLGGQPCLPFPPSSPRRRRPPLLPPRPRHQTGQLPRRAYWRDPTPASMTQRTLSSSSSSRYVGIQPSQTENGVYNGPVCKQYTSIYVCCGAIKPPHPHSPANSSHRQESSSYSAASSTGPSPSSASPESSPKSWGASSSGRRS